MSVNCPVCGWSFRSEESLRGHIASHHPDVAEAQGARPQDEAVPETDTASAAAPEGRRPSTWLLVLAYAAALLLPIGGVVAGVYLLVRYRSAHGIAVIAISLAVFGLLLAANL